jgi:hypothetical protein
VYGGVSLYAEKKVDRNQPGISDGTYAGEETGCIPGYPGNLATNPRVVLRPSAESSMVFILLILPPTFSV